MKTHPNQQARARRAWRLTAISLAGVALLAACGGDDDASSDSTAAPAAAPAATAAPATTAGANDAYGDDYGDDAPATAETAAPAAAGAAMVATAESTLGTVLVDANGMTLYAFTNDADGEPTCVDGCAEAWPPALVEGELQVGDLDAALFTTVEHPLGTQLKAGDWPLYTFAGDSAAGDTNGQGSGGVWFVMAPDGTLIK